jgi:hypothetical protein
MPKIPTIERVRVFAVESPSALDFFENRTESQTLQAVCRLLGHDFASTLVRSEAEFKTALDHATSINPEQIKESERRRPLCLHIAAHGDSSGLALGADNLSWEELADCLWDFFRKMEHYPGRQILVISACGASNQKLTNFFQGQARKKDTPKPPAYVITTVGNDEGDVYWSDSVVAWSIFYHQIGKAVLSAKADIQLILDKVQLVGAGKLKYFRWDTSKKLYFNYISTAKEHSSEAGAFKASSPTTKRTPRGRQSRQ